MADSPSLPSHVDLLWPTVQALRALGGSGSIDEIVEKVVELEDFTEEQQAVPHLDGPRSEIEYRLAWSRTYLKGMGLLDNSARGVWALTDKGRDPSLDEKAVLRLNAEYSAMLRAQSERAARPDVTARRPRSTSPTRTSAATGRRSCSMPCLRCRRQASSGWLSDCYARLGSSAQR